MGCVFWAKLVVNVSFFTTLLQSLAGCDLLLHFCCPLERGLDFNDTFCTKFNSIRIFTPNFTQNQFKGPISGPPYSCKWSNLFLWERRLSKSSGGERQCCKYVRFIRLWYGIRPFWKKCF